MLRTRIALAVLALLPILLIISLVRSDRDHDHLDIEIHDLRDEHRPGHAHEHQAVERRRIIERRHRGGHGHRTQVVEHTYRVEPGGLLRVEAPGASVSLATGTDDHVQLAAWAELEDGADCAPAESPLEIDQQNNTINVRQNEVDCAEDEGLTIKIIIPRWFDIDIKLLDGSIQAGVHEGRIRLETTDGDVQAESLTGERVFVRTADGDVQVGSLSSPDALVQTADGDIHVRHAVGDALTIRTADGSIHVRDLQGHGQLITADGDVRVARVEGSGFELRASDGDIEVGHLLTEASQLRTGHGSLRIGHVEGTLRGSTSHGDIHVSLARPDAIDLETLHGDIELRVPEDLRASLDLSAPELSVSPVFGDRWHESATPARVRIDLNGGGATISAHTDEGTLSMRTN